jgi:hypothetical protein
VQLSPTGVFLIHTPKPHLQKTSTSYAHFAAAQQHNRTPQTDKMAVTARSASLGSRATASRGFLGKRVAAASNGARYVMKAGNWLPGSDFPAWIPEDAPGCASRLPQIAADPRQRADRVAAVCSSASSFTVALAAPVAPARASSRPCHHQPDGRAVPCRRSAYGFDPLGLAKDPVSLKRFQEAEVIHSRWAMLGVAGCLGVEALGFGNWYDAPTWVSRRGASLAAERAAWRGCDARESRSLVCRTSVKRASGAQRRSDLPSCRSPICPPLSRRPSQAAPPPGSASVCPSTSTPCC